MRSVTLIMIGAGLTVMLMATAGFVYLRATGWRTGTTAGEESSWHLVHFIRHLPTLTPAELDSMKARNPRSPEDIRFEIEEERFLNEGAQK